MKKIQDLHFSNKRLTAFFVSHYSKLITGVFFVLICFGFYLLYQLLYPTLINPKPISPNEINIQKEKIDLTRYTETGEKLLIKGDENDNIIVPGFLKTK